MAARDEMSEHPILRAIQQMRDDYAGSPGVDGAAPMEITLHGGPSRSGFASVYNGLVSFKPFREEVRWAPGRSATRPPRPESRWFVAEFAELINPDFIVSIVDVERWPGSDG